METIRRALRPTGRGTPRDLAAIASRGERGGGHQAERFLLFAIGDERFAVTASFLREVVLPDGMAPGAASEARECAAFSHRGFCIPALDLRVLFGYSAGVRAEAARVLVGGPDGGGLGLVVDRVGDVVDIGPQAILAMPDGASRLPAACFRGILRWRDGVVMVLEPAGLAALECVREFGDVVVSPRVGAG